MIGSMVGRHTPTMLQIASGNEIASPTLNLGTK